MKTRSLNFLHASQIKPEITGEGISRQIAVGYIHEHFHSQTTYVASGKFEVSINGEKQILEAGDGFYIEPDAPHGAICLEDGILIDVFSPMRMDFLKI